MLRWLRAFLLCTWPMMLYGVVYFSLGLIPRLMPIDVQPLYELECRLFGVTTDSGVITLAEWFTTHNWPWADLLSGVCYICWVPVPILFTLHLFFFVGRRQTFSFALTFLLMNIIGFGIHILHPAAAPWYVLEHGFAVLPDTASNAAGLLRFDALVGSPVFESIYRGSTNVFGAFPSLHAAKMSMVALFAIIICRQKRRGDLIAWSVFASLITAGTWFAAVYTAHHYVLDVLAGILLVAVGYTLTRLLLRRMSYPEL